MMRLVSWMIGRGILAFEIPRPDVAAFARVGVLIDSATAPDVDVVADLRRLRILKYFLMSALEKSREIDATLSMASSVAARTLALGDRAVGHQHGNGGFAGALVRKAPSRRMTSPLDLEQFGVDLQRVVGGEDRQVGEFRDETPVSSGLGWNSDPPCGESSSPVLGHFLEQNEVRRR